MSENERQAGRQASRLVGWKISMQAGRRGGIQTDNNTDIQRHSTAQHINKSAAAVPDMVFTRIYILHFERNSPIALKIDSQTCSLYRQENLRKNNLSKSA